MMLRLTILLALFSPSSALGQDPHANITNVTYILEDEVPGLGIKVDLSEWVSKSDMSKMAQNICQAVAPEMLRKIEKREDMETPTFIEVDAKVPRSFGILSVNVGQVRRFSYKNETCFPLWKEE